MLSPRQRNHFDTFGYLFLNSAFDDAEIDAITRTLEEVWAEDSQPPENEERHTTGVVESRRELTPLVLDQRIYPALEQLLGPDPLWVGSEGIVSGSAAIGWHPDRKYYLREEEGWMDFDQVKIMMYLDRVGRDGGCLRVIPGSHRMPLHRDLAQQELNPGAQPFGLPASEIPCMALESQPGDVILFDHRLWHASFGGGRRRRYLAMKFAQRPTAARHIASLRKYGAGVFAPAESFVRHEDPRIRALVRVPAV